MLTRVRAGWRQRAQIIPLRIKGGNPRKHRTRETLQGRNKTCRFWRFSSILTLKQGEGLCSLSSQDILKLLHLPKWRRNPSTRLSQILRKFWKVVRVDVQRQGYQLPGLLCKEGSLFCLFPVLLRQPWETIGMLTWSDWPGSWWLLVKMPGSAIRRTRWCHENAEGLQVSDELQQLFPKGGIQNIMRFIQQKVKFVHAECDTMLIAKCWRCSLTSICSSPVACENVHHHQLGSWRKRLVVIQQGSEHILWVCWIKVHTRLQFNWIRWRWYVKLLSIIWSRLSATPHRALECRVVGSTVLGSAHMHTATSSIALWPFDVVAVADLLSIWCMRHQFQLGARQEGHFALLKALPFSLLVLTFARWPGFTALRWEWLVELCSFGRPLNGRKSHRWSEVQLLQLRVLGDFTKGCLSQSQKTAMPQSTHTKQEGATPTLRETA